MIFINAVRKYWLVLISLFLALIYYWPIIYSKNLIGIQDWDQNFAWNEFVRVSFLKYKQFPFWNPYKCGGSPHFAYPEAGVFSIQTLLVIFLGSVIGIKISIFLHGVIGFVGFYLLSRQYNLSKESSVLAATIFSFNGVISSFLSTGMVVFINYAYTPYIIYFYNKGKRRKKWIIISALFYALSFYFSHQIPLILSIFILLYSLIKAIFERNKIWVFNFLLFFVFFTLFTFPKLVLSLQLISIYPRLFHDFSGFKLSHLLYFLISRKQNLLEDINITNYTYGIDENSLYVGILPIISFLLFFLKIKESTYKYFELILIFILSIIFMLGFFINPSPYATLKGFPFFSSFRVAQRFRFNFIIIFSLFSGIGFDIFYKSLNFLKSDRIKKLLFTIFVFLIFYDLTSFASKNFFSKTLIINDNFPNFFKKQFSQIEHSIPNNFIFSYKEGAIPKELENSRTFSPWSLEYINLRQNKGIVHCYDSLTLPVYPVGKENKKYQGEYYLENSSKKAILEKWTPNSFSFSLKSTNENKKDNVLIINQNYYPGWYVKINGYNLPTINKNGLLAAKIPFSTQFVEFNYLPYNYLLNNILRVIRGF